MCRQTIDMTAEICYKITSTKWKGILRGDCQMGDYQNRAKINMGYPGVVLGGPHHSFRTEAAFQFLA